MIDAITSSVESVKLTSENISSATGPVEPGFMEMVINKAADIDKAVNTANDTLQQYALGKGVATHELMLQLETAKYELQMAIEVRNKVVEAYQELLRMQL